MKIFKYIALAVALAGAVSCSVVSRSSYAPSSVELQLGMDDLEYLGETEISITYDTYLFIFSRIRSINGADFDPGVVKRAGLSNAKTGLFRLGRKLGRASYLVYEKFPDADYFVVTKQLSKKTVLVLGSEIETCAVVKAYKFK
ncbi:MAG: hypothetical protein IKR69_01045 [Bacteroidales bacterium]|nr:hypothetical protein [Bacteroidales bacterium]